MNLLLISIVVVGTSIQGIMQKAYNIKVSGGTYSFTAASVTAALVVFLISSGGRLQFRADVAVYAILFAVSYGSSIFCSLMSIRTGPLSISALITSYSLIIPSLYGILALGEPVKKTMVAGIILLLVSLLLVNLKKDKNEKKTSSKWWIYVIIAFIGGGMCSTVQKVQQVAFDGKYKSELMIVALSVTALIMFGAAFFSEKEKIATSLKKGFVWYAICGLANGVVNLLVMVLSNSMPASVMFPVISAGGIILTTLVSVFVYKEKLSRQQITGFVFGTVSVILLNM